MGKILLIITLLLLTLIQLAIVSAEEVNVGVYVLNLGEYSPATGSFSADFYLHFKCKNTCNPETFEFTNGRADSVSMIENLPNERFYRIHANLNSPVDLKKFPFDRQKMQIIIEDANSTIENIEYNADYKGSGIDSSIVFPGWDIDGWDAEVRRHYYPVYNETYSQYIFTITVSRIFLSSFIKTFLPVLLILLVVLFSFLLGTSHIPEILAMNGSGLIAAVMFHTVIANQIPPVGYLTFADKFMIVSYIIILTAFILNTYTLGLVARKKKEVAEKMHAYTKYKVFAWAALMYIILFAFFL